jgi:peptidyl-prolyl cis-trans isomerase C
MIERLAVVALGLSIFVARCSSSREPPPPPVVATLPSGVVASVGSLPIASDRVAAVSKAQQISPADALKGEIRDAIFASAALQRGYDDALGVRAALRGQLARARLEQLPKEADQSEPSDAEVAGATARHFLELDRPEAFRVIHALVKVDAKADTGKKLQARALAERLAERVAAAADADDFRQRAESISDRAGLEVVVETLKPVAADGRVFDPEGPPAELGHYELPFARAASRLTQAGQKSGIVSTVYGLHVLMLIERTPAKVVPLEDRRRILREEILTDRAKQLKSEVLQSLRSSARPVVERSTEELLSTIDVSAHEAP